ncbi:MAG: small-conductance mechanosensitive channel [Saprospiraceae bacterium]|jgi:small-conductance mechanosensitive channel
MLNKIFDFELFPLGNLQFTVGQLIALLFLIVTASVLWRLTKAKWRIAFFTKNEVDPDNRRRFERHLRQLIILVAIFLSIRILGLDFELYNSGAADSDSSIILRYSIVIIALIILVLAWLTEWVFSNILIHKYERDRREDISQNLTDTYEEVRTKIIRLVQYIVIVLAAMAIINNFGLDYGFFNYDDKAKETTSMTPNKILIIVLIFLLARMLSWILTQVALYSIFKKREIDQGTRFAINQLLQYVIYVIAFYLALKSLDIDMTLILGASAALLVGVGLGLQQTFNDFFSGLVLLFERSVSVGDVMQVGEQIGAVKKIGLRSSIIETIENVSIIVPNSKLVNDSVKNWSHFEDHARFEVKVGVAYGSETALVKKLLLEAVKDHHLVLDYPVPFVRFVDFADSSLAFSVLFYTNRFFIVEEIKSDIRFKIDKAFRDNNVMIPFPQRDVWMRGGGE